MSVAVDVKYWLERIYMMSRSAIVDLHPKDATNIYTTIKVLSDEKEELERVVSDLAMALKLARAESAALAAKKPKKKA